MHGYLRQGIVAQGVMRAARILLAAESLELADNAPPQRVHVFGLPARTLGLLSVPHSNMPWPRGRLLDGPGVYSRSSPEVVSVRKTPGVQYACLHGVAPDLLVVLRTYRAQS